MEAASTTITLRLLDQTLELLACGAVYWRERSTLFLADLHIGKDATFRASALPVPAGASVATLQSLRRTISRTSAKHVCVLGDFLHARSSLSDTVVKSLDQFWSEYAHVSFLLVEGNHDVTSRKRLQSFPLDVVSSPYYMEPFWLVHDCETQWSSASQLHRLHAATLPKCSAHSDDAFALGGHLHPAIKIRVGRNQEKLHCFHQTNRWLTLPAFGEFTGNKLIHPGAEERVYGIAGERVFDATGLMTARERTLGPKRST